jgi:hypothetical protein
VASGFPSEGFNPGLLGDPRHLASQPGGAEIDAILAAGREAFAPIAHRFRDLDAQGRSGKALDDLCASFVHLPVNRLGGFESISEQRSAVSSCGRATASTRRLFVPPPASIHDGFARGNISRSWNVPCGRASVLEVRNRQSAIGNWELGVGSGS